MLASYGYGQGGSICSYGYGGSLSSIFTVEVTSDTYKQTNVYTLGSVLPIAAIIKGASLIIGTLIAVPGIPIRSTSSRAWWKYPNTGSNK